MKSNITDMTSGAPAKHILLFALPALVGNVFQQIYNIADSVIVGPLFLILFIQLFSKTITGLFVEDQDVIMLGTRGLKITSLFYPALGMIYVIRGVLSGIGDAFFPLFNGIVEVIGRFTIRFILTGFMGFGETGIWYSCGIVWFISGFTAWIRYVTFFHNKMIKYRK